ncbi:hypothetical protein M011DRAFT_489479 [Sporormia fimetaria CBS 119925]|uniref:F-box domain-containing protein n=1 Tax=Sporormia fimetaria CBS 119925 TaxID=1340428 RepID=A0A6A6V2B5_9PLEO|nr:hypothetical protein M011DRAFT_489479 [Sporormia fimetaria CBS 119925]
MANEEYAPTSQFPLLSLPAELTLLVVEQVEARDDLINLSLTCRRLQELAEPLIWRSLLILHGTHARRVRQAVWSRRERMDAIQQLDIFYGDEFDQDDIGLLDKNNFFCHLRKLRHLTIEGPCPNNHGGWTEGTANFPSYTRINYTQLIVDSVQSGLQGFSFTRTPDLLSMLQTLTLHGHRNAAEPFTLGGASAIFLHPTLRKLTISCSDFDGPWTIDDIEPGTLKTTPLESLTLIECNIYLSLLEIALRLPKALRELSLNERKYVWEGCRPDHSRPRTDSPDFITLLAYQASSLQRITHNSEPLQGGTEIAVGRPLPNAYLNADQIEALSTFTALTDLEISVTSVLTHLPRYSTSLTNLRLNDSDATVGFHMTPISLRLHGLYRRIFHTTCETCTASNLPNIDLVLSLPGRPSIELEEHFCAANPDCLHNRRCVYWLAAVLKARKRRFRIFVEEFINHSNLRYIPPYMYGEEPPVETCVYNSDDLWTFANRRTYADDREELDPFLKAVCAPGVDNLVRVEKTTNVCILILRTMTGP